jgi:type II secretory ATPase GspE/PulE/Tfp pilus assembly ATPase PilB-like protein
MDRMGFTEDNLTVYHGAGCEECRNTGYSGRTGIFELMIVDSEMRRLILERASSDVIRKRAVSNGMQVLRDNGLYKVKQGITTIEEVLRVAQEGI